MLILVYYPISFVIFYPVNPKFIILYKVVQYNDFLQFVSSHSFQYFDWFESSGVIKYGNANKYRSIAIGTGKKFGFQTNMDFLEIII